MTAPGRWVLLVEDDADLRSSLAELIATWGYFVAEATNGLEALAWLDSHPQPALLLVDLAMPVLNGLRFRERQLVDPRIASIPTVAMTAGRILADQVEALRFQGVLSKPLDVPLLLTTLQQHCAPAGDALHPGELR